MIKRNGVSFVRPLGAMEYLILMDSDANASPDIFTGDSSLTQMPSSLSDDPGLAQDVIHLMKAIGMVNENVPNNLKEEFAHSLSRLASPDQVE